LLLLPTETEKVWNFLKGQPALTGFVLVGGSALSMRIQHRLSEDLDFAFLQASLPRQRLEARLHRAREAGQDFQCNDNEAALQEFALGGMELRDYQQAFLVNGGVKVSFFAANAPMVRVLSAPPETGPRVASLAELFKTKCLISASRSKTRDWLELYLLLRDHGFSIRDYQAAFEEAGIESQCDLGLSRLCSGLPQSDDEGYAQLLTNAPSLEEMTAFFVAQRESLEIESAAKAARWRLGDGAHGGS
jgi:DNA-binding transcriptional MerR regulator